MCTCVNLSIAWLMFVAASNLKSEINKSLGQTTLSKFGEVWSPLQNHFWNPLNIFIPTLTVELVCISLHSPITFSYPFPTKGLCNRVTCSVCVYVYIISILKLKETHLMRPITHTIVISRKWASITVSRFKLIFMQNGRCIGSMVLLNKNKLSYLWKCKINYHIYENLCKLIPSCM